MARIDSPRRQERRARRLDHDEFYETMAAPTAQPYYDQEAVRVYSPVEQFVRVVAGILNVLLALRFVLALFTSDTASAIVAVIFNVTNWLVAPFQSLFGTPPSEGGGFFDLPALAAIVFVALLAWIIGLIVRGPRANEV